jgi:hypothetical protein
MRDHLGKEFVLESRRVVIATGIYDQPRLLGKPIKRVGCSNRENQGSLGGFVVTPGCFISNSVWNRAFQITVPGFRFG